MSDNSFSNLIRVEGEKAYWKNGMYMGDILMDVDGFYKYWPEQRGGYWDETLLFAMAYKLLEMNKKWQEIIDNDPRISDRHGSNDVEQRESF